jgi:ribosomal protein S18 acetylase RimI-like enzyme
MEARSIALDPELIGRRLTLRLHDPAGGYRDLVGILETMTTMRKRDGEVVAFNPDQIAIVHPIAEVEHRAGKGAPLSLRIAELEELSTRTWPPHRIEMVGQWRCRVSNGATYRANSVLITGAPPFGEPGVDLDEAIAAVDSIYRNAGLPTVFQLTLPTYQEFNDYLTARGWSEKLGAAFLINDLEATFEIQELAREKKVEITDENEPSDAFLALHDDHALLPIMMAYPARYIALTHNQEIIATARVAVSESWAVVTRLIVAENHRKQGLARLLMLVCMNSAIENGASKMCLQVDQSNPDAQSLYAKLGFRFHHTYHYIQRAESNECPC